MIVGIGIRKPHNTHNHVKKIYSLGENSFCHVTMDFNKPWSFKYNRKKENEEIDMYDFTVNDCTQKQNGSPYYEAFQGG